MNILILGDVMGSSGRKAIKKNLSKIINENEIDFTIINGENAADDGKGITSSIAEEFFLQGEVRWEQVGHEGWGGRGGREGRLGGGVAAERGSVGCGVGGAEVLQAAEHLLLRSRFLLLLLPSFFSASGD